MPIRTNRTVRDYQQRFRPNDPRTATFALDERPPDYKPPVPEERFYQRGALETATLNHDLRYFQAVANGDEQPETDKTLCLVLNFFRATQTHIKPIAERFTLGQAAGAPYYALHAAPHTSSSDEYNNLIIQRRDPISAVYAEACVSVVQPKMNLHAGGSHVVATITRKAVTYNLSWGDAATIGILGGCYCLWDDRDGSALAQMYSDEGWRSLSHTFSKGIIWVKKVKVQNAGTATPIYENPRDEHVEKLGSLDFQRECPQFVSENPTAHQTMDVVIGALFTMLVLETRKADQIEEFGSLPAYSE